MKITFLVFWIVSSASLALAQSSGRSAATRGASTVRGWTEVGAGLQRSPVEIGKLVMDPLSPSTVYAVGYAGKLFKTLDGGETWGLVKGAVGLTSLVVDSADSAILYGIAYGVVIKSRDTGQTWSSVSTGLPAGSLNVFLIMDPQNATTLYTVDLSGHIFKTTDGGATWAPKNTGLPLSVEGVVIDPTNSSVIYAQCSGAGLYKSTDGGESWHLLVQGFGGLLAIDPIDPSTLYNFRSPQVLKSTGGGESWQTTDTGIQGFFRSVLIDSSRTIYASYGSGDNSTGGVIKSTDGGAHWTRLTVALPSYAPPTYLPPPISSLALNPANPSTIFAGYFDLHGGRGGVFKTTDGGATWNDKSTGLALLSTHALAVDPVKPGTVYVAAGDGVSRTTDGGLNWSTAHFPPPGPGTTYVASLVLNPDTPDILYATVGATFGCTSNVDRGFHFLKKSEDGGATWSDLAAQGCATASQIPLAIDPRDSNVLYAIPVCDWEDCPCGPLHKTNDGGTSWNKIYFDCIGPVLAVDPGNSNTLYATGGPNRVIKSTDGGGTWVSTGLTNVSVSALAIDPIDPNTLYAGTIEWPGDVPGLFKSTDGGASWFALTTGLEGVIALRQPITVLVADPKQPVLYVGTAGSGVFQSTDGGATWTGFNNGLPDRDIRALTVSPDGSGAVYAATADGVFRKKGAARAGRIRR